jgi:uncharacterized protein YjiS (DUF1127 family)
MLMLPAIAAPRFAKPASAALSMLRRVGRWCLSCQQRYEQRRHLAELDAHMLKDVGLTPEQAAEESAKPWWRP